MNTSYTFQAEKFALTDDSLHLLRNGFNYETIPLHAIESIEIRDGKDLKNWLWVLFIGLALTIYALWDVFQILFILNDENTHHIYVERLLIPIIPFSLGVYSIFIALRNTRVMIVKASAKTYYLSLRHIVNNKQFIEFTGYLKQIYPTFQNLSRL
jgi:hypothetical protein